MIFINTNTQKRRLGRTGIQVTPIGLGGNQFSGGKGVFGMMLPDLSQKQVNAIVKAALDGGINWFDTAEMYGFGHSEQALSRGLKAAGKQNDQVFVATKWNPILRTAGNISRSIDTRLKFLDGYTIDLYMVHNPYGFSSPETEMDAMANLVEAGKIRSIGVSNFNAGQMRRAYEALEKRGLPLAVNQVQYSLLDRKIESNGVLDAARELGVTIVAWAPLGTGLLTGKYHKDPDLVKSKPPLRGLMARRNIKRSHPVVLKLEEIAPRHNATAAQVALNWVINFQGKIVVAIPGASRRRHAEQSAGAMGFSLSQEEMDQLDAISRQFC
jgi:aryl-alcohol dehydrogenase-like predicted oxidoreductase